MRVMRDVVLSCEELAAAVRETVRADMEAALGRTVAADEAVAGCVYTKQLANRMGLSERVEVTVERLDEGGYTVEFSSRYGTNGIVYTFTPRATGGATVTYEETFGGASTSSSLSHALFSKLTSRGNRKRMAAQLERFCAFAEARAAHVAA